MTQPVVFDVVLKVADCATHRYWEDTFLKVIPSLKQSSDASAWELVFEFLKKDELSTNKHFIFEKLLSNLSGDENFINKVKAAYDSGSIAQSHK